MGQLRDSSGHVDFVNRLQTWDQQWRARTQRSNPPWKGATSYATLLTWSKVEDIHAIMFGYFSGTNYYSLAASSLPNSAGQELIRERSEVWTELLRWSQLNESNSRPLLDRWLHDGILFGSGFGKLGWQRLQRSSQADFPLPQTLANREDLSDKEAIRSALRNRLKAGPKPLDDNTFEITFIDEDGEERDGVAWVDRNNPFRAAGNAHVIVERDFVLREAPYGENVAPWNMVIPPDARDLQSARRYFERGHLAYDEIARLAQSGLFNAVSRADLKELRERTLTSRIEENASSYESEDAVEARRDVELGTSVLQTRQELFKVVYEYAFEDVDGDGFAESIVRAMVDTTRPILLMRHRIEYLYPHARRPHFDWHLYPVDNRYYGMGVPELLEGTQGEANAFYRSRGDLVELLSKPAGLYDPMSINAPEKLRLTPGSLVKARDPQRSYQPLVWAADPGILIREQSGMEREAEMGVGSTDLGLGRSPGQPNAPRTLGGTAIIVRQQQLRMQVLLMRAMYGRGEGGGGIQEYLLQYHQLYQALMPEEKQFRLLGTDEIKKVTRSELQGRYDFVIDFGQELNNPQLAMQNSLLRYQNGMQNPLVVTNQDAMWKLTVDMLEQTGLKGASRWIPRPSGGGSHPPMDQKEELAVMAKGIYVEPLATDSHVEHLAAIQQAIQDPIGTVEAGLTPDTMLLVGRHAQRHFEMMAVAQGQQGPSLPGGNGGPRSPRSTLAMSQYGASGIPGQTPVAGPIEADTEVM